MSQYLPGITSEWIHSSFPDPEILDQRRVLMFGKTAEARETAANSKILDGLNGNEKETIK